MGWEFGFLVYWFAECDMRLIFFAKKKSTQKNSRSCDEEDSAAMTSRRGAAPMERIAPVFI